MKNLGKMGLSKFEYTNEQAEFRKSLIPKCANSKIKRIRSKTIVLQFYHVEITLFPNFPLRMNPQARFSGS